MLCSEVKKKNSALALYRFQVSYRRGQHWSFQSAVSQHTLPETSLIDACIQNSASHMFYFDKNKQEILKNVFALYYSDSCPPHGSAQHVKLCSQKANITTFKQSKISLRSLPLKRTQKKWFQKQLSITYESLFVMDTTWLYELNYHMKHSPTQVVNSICKHYTFFLSSYEPTV